MIAVLLLVLLWGCGQGRGNDAEATPPPPTRPYFQGYSLVSSWYKNPHLPSLLRQANLNITEIEWVTKEAMAPCPHGAPRAQDWFGLRPEDAHLFVNNARANGVTTFINVVNANNCAAMAQNDAWFVAQVQTVLALGLDHVIISPVSEPWASPAKAEHWIELARQIVPFDHLVLPHGFGDAAFVDEHYCNDKDLLYALAHATPYTTVLHNTDCTPILNPGVERATIFANEARQNQSPLLIFDFYGEQPDSSVINALR